MKKPQKENNYAFIDSQNINLGVNKMGWQLDFTKFHRFLKDKYRVTKAYLFIGYIPSNKKLYDYLTKVGYTIIFKPVIESRGVVKGNVDAELVLQTMHELCTNTFDKAVIVSGDGDFTCLARYLHKRNKLKIIIAPTKHSTSSLLKNKFNKYLTFLNFQKKKLGK